MSKTRKQKALDRIKNVNRGPFFIESETIPDGYMRVGRGSRKIGPDHSDHTFKKAFSDFLADFIPFAAWAIFITSCVVSIILTINLFLVVFSK